MVDKVILIVDDEADVIAYLTAVLDNYDCRIYSANNAEDGFNKAMELHPDLICLDIMMPEESGISLYTKLRNSKKMCDIPVIIISGVEQAHEFDFFKFVNDRSIPPPEHYFEKPIDVDEFCNVVNRLAFEDMNPKAKDNSS